MKLQMYECRLRRSGVLHLADGASEKLADERQAAAFFCRLFRGLAHEQVWVVFLDGQHRVRGALRVGEGGVHGCALKPSDVFRPVLVSGCSNFMLAHNHPSGDVTPSRADLELTRQVSRSATLVGLYLVDHVIVAPGPGTVRGGDYSSIRACHPEVVE